MKVHSRYLVLTKFILLFCFLLATQTVYSGTLEHDDYTIYFTTPFRQALIHLLLTIMVSQNLVAPVSMKLFAMVFQTIEFWKRAISLILISLFI